MAASDRGAFVWYELMTPDPAGAKAFYDAVVGWTIQADAQLIGASEYRMIGRGDGGHAGGVLTLTPTMQGQGGQPGWVGYIHHPDVDAAVATITAAGGAVHMAPSTMEGVGRMAMVADPQGAVFYIMDPTPPAGQADATSTVFDYAKPQHVRWNELQTDDPAAAVELYCELFGWRQEGAMAMGELGDYQFLHRGEGMIGAVMPRMPGVPRSGWSFYIGVEDIDRAAEAVTATGGMRLGEIQEIPGGEFSLHVMDPQGAAIGLVGPRKG